MLIICSFNVKAQTITPALAQKIGNFCEFQLDYNRGSMQAEFCTRCLFNKYNIPMQGLYKAYRSMANNRDMAGDIVLTIYRYVNGDEDYFFNVLKDWFSTGEIDTMVKFCRPRFAKEQKTERERKRIEEETKRKNEEEEAQRRQEEIRQRQNHIDQFLAEREQKIYELDATQYEKNKEQIYSIIGNVIIYNKIRNMTFTLTDECVVDYNGKNNHAVEIQGISDRSLAREIKKAVENSKFEVMKVIEPYSQESYPVTAKAEYIIPYTVTTTTEKLTLLKNRDGLNLVKGDELFFKNVQGDIVRDLRGKGKYDVVVTELLNGNRKSVGTSVLSFRKSNRFFIGFSGTNITDKVGGKISLGVTDINSSIFGLYGSYGSRSYGTDPSTGGSILDENYFGGIVLSVSNIVALYGGLGGVSENKASYTSQDGQAVYYDPKTESYVYYTPQTKTTVKQSNFSTELGIMIRIKHFYISSDWDYVVNSKQRFNIGCGIIF